MSQLTLRELHRELRLCQRRLGTPKERPEDFERALNLAHELNNHITAAYLREAVDSLPDLEPSVIAVAQRVLAH